MFSVTKTRYTFLDASFIPTIGGPVSLVVMIAILYWRIRADLFPDIIVAVGIARLAMVPVLMAVDWRLGGH